MSDDCDRKTILVTGSDGFIGQHLCRKLGETDHAIGIDNYVLSYSRNNLRWPNRMDIADEDSWLMPIGWKLSHIYNLACPASPKLYQRFPIETMMTCVAGVHNGLQRAKRDSARYLQASTSEVYGDPLRNPQAESYLGNVNPVGPRSCYDEGKRAAESLCADYKRLGMVDARIARIFNTYGPGMQEDDGRVIPNFICQSLRGQPLTVYGDGTQTRSLCYIDDMVDGLIALMEADDPPTPMNLGNPEEIQIIDLAKLIVELTQSSSTIEYRDLPVDDPKKRCPDITLAKSNLQWSPKTPLVDGLAKTIAYFKEQQRIEI